MDGWDGMGWGYLFTLQRELLEKGILCDLTCTKITAYVDKGRERAGGDALYALESGGRGIGIGIEDEGVPGSGRSEITGESEDIVVVGVGRRGRMGSDEVEAEGVDEDEDCTGMGREERGVVLGSSDVGERETGEEEAPGEEVDACEMSDE